MVLDTADIWDVELGEQISKALIQEQTDILEADLAMDEVPPESGQAPAKMKLPRDLKREALARLEDAARTQLDFEEVIGGWDKLEANEVRRVSNHEVSRGDIPLERGLQRNPFLSGHTVIQLCQNRRYSWTERPQYPKGPGNAVEKAEEEITKKAD